VCPPSSSHGPLLRLSVSNIRMALRVLVLLVLSSLKGVVWAQDAPNKGLSPECTKTIRVRTPSPLDPFKFGQDGKYRGAPIIKYQIQEDGSVADVALTRSSGIGEIDRKYLGAIAKWKFKPRSAGCGAI
jgi:TonB family protein